MSGITPMQQAIVVLIGVFKTYAEKDGEKKTISKAAAKLLLQEEFGNLGGTNAVADKMLKALDQDGDAKVDFMEFCSLVVNFSLQFHEITSELEK